MSDSEFEVLKAKSEAAGSRNVSDFARLALCAPEGRQIAAADFDLLRQELQMLTASVQHLIDERQPGTAPQRPSLSAVGRKNGGV